MAEFDRPTYAASTGSAAAVDQGLRSYMLRVYNYMTIGLVVTGFVAWFGNNLAVTQDQSAAVAQAPNGLLLTQVGVWLYTSPLQWIVMLAPLAFVFALSFGINKMSTAPRSSTFWAFSAVMGLSLSSIFLVYTGQSIIARCSSSPRPCSAG